MMDEAKRAAVLDSHLNESVAIASRVKLARLLSGETKAGAPGEVIEFDGKDYLLIEEWFGFALVVETGMTMPAPLLLIPATYKEQKR